MDEFFGSDYSNEERQSGSEFSAGSGHSDGEAQNYQSEVAERSDGSEPEISGSEEGRNESDVEQNTHSDDERSSHSDAASSRSHHSRGQYGENGYENRIEPDVGVHSEREKSEESEVERSGSEGHQSDAEVERSDSEGHHSEPEGERSGSEEPQSDVEMERSGSEGHHSDVEGIRSGSEGHQSDAEVERSGSEKHHSDIEERSESEGQQSDAEIEQYGSDGQQSDGEIQRANSDAEVERSDSEGHHSEAEAERSGSEKHHSDGEGYEMHVEQSDVERSDEGEQPRHLEAEESDHSEDAEETNHIVNGEQLASDKDEQSDQEIKSGSEEEIISRKRKRVTNSDDESEKGSESERIPKKISHSDSANASDEDGAKATEQDLFGGDVGDISSDDEAQAKLKSDDEKENEIIEKDILQEEEEQEHEEPAPETRIEVEIPRITTNLGKEIHFIKLPNFLSVDTRPYDPQWYEDEIDEDEVLDEEGRARLKLKVENTVRWRNRYDELGNQIRESNARIIRWSDGSLSLHLGSEIFDIHRQLLMQGDHNHLFIRQGTGLQGQAVFRTKLTFRPHSTDSFTHRKMTLSLADRNQKTQKIRVLPNVGKDPEAHRSEMIKKEEDRLKASIRRENKQRRIREKAHNRGLSASYLESDRYEEDDDGAISLAAIKNKYKKGGAALRDRPSIYSSDEEVSDEEKAKRLEQVKSLDDDDDDDSDLDYFERKKAIAEGKKKMATIEESDEES